jgi:protein arginine N-methyltransferase 1
MADKITLIRGKVEEVALPVDKVDIIISEWMGYFLLFESMLDTVLYARDKYLVEGGLMLPDKVSLHMIGLEDAKYMQEKFGFWDNVYGVKMTSLKRIALSEPLVEKVPKRNIVTSTCTFFELDLYEAKVEDLTFAHKYSIRLNSNDTVHALACWFDADFTRLKRKQKLTTSPYKSSTHWQQTIFYLGTPIKATKGNTINGSIAVKKSEENFRELDIKLSFHYRDGKEDINCIQLYKLR